MLWGKKQQGGKKCQILALTMYSSYHASVHVSPGGGLEVGQTLWVFEKPFACKLIYSGAKWRLTICILESNTQQENFCTLTQHIKCSFLQVCEESGLSVGLF